MDNTRQKHMRDILIASVIIAATVVCCAVFIIKLTKTDRPVEIMQTAVETFYEAGELAKEK